MENRKNLEFLFQKYVNNSCTKEELDQLLSLITLPENIEFLENAISDFWKKEDRNIYSGEIDKHGEHLLIEFRKRYKRKPSKNMSIAQAKTKIHVYQLILKVAAVILLVVSITIAVRSFSVKKEEKQIVTTHIPATVNKVAMAGERLKVNLSDGSLVTLKAGSKLVSPEKFEGRLRNIKLNGEAFFKVKPDKSHPFIVKADNFTVKVLGTSFNVYSYHNENLARVTVKTGKVEVRIDNHNGSEPSVFILLPGEQIELNKATGESTLKRIDVNQYTSWIDEELSFDETPLPEVIKRIENCYGVKIMLHIPDAEKTEITGKYKNDSLAGILRLLTFSTGTTYSITGTKVIIDKK